MNPLENRKKGTIIHILRKTRKKYPSRGFIICDIFGDNEFDVDDIKSAILPATMHICAVGEYVPTIERPTRTIKERGRTICHSLPFTSFPKIMTKSLARVITQWMNAFPSTGGVSDRFIPSNIVLGLKNPDFNRKRLLFVSYVYAYSGTDNTMESRSYRQR